VVVKAIIKNPDGKVVATGHAEEKRNASFINRTSALENAETSAIGRALASAGFIGSEFASADEVAIAIQAQANSKVSLQAQKKVDGKALAAMFKPASESETVAVALIQVPDITKEGWEETPVPARFLPYAERKKPISWKQLILDTVTLQGKNKKIKGAAYLHILTNWRHPLIQRPEVQAVIKAALSMRECMKAARASQVKELARV
jgi:hypothetical protein